MSDYKLGFFGEEIDIKLQQIEELRGGYSTSTKQRNYYGCYWEDKCCNRSITKCKYRGGKEYTERDNYRSSKHYFVWDFTKRVYKRRQNDCFVWWSVIPLQRCFNWIYTYSIEYNNRQTNSKSIQVRNCSVCYHLFLSSNRVLLKLN